MLASLEISRIIIETTLHCIYREGSKWGRKKLRRVLSPGM
jgi:hypothetical protein